MLYQIARALPGRTVFAAGDDTRGIDRVEFDENGKLTSVTFLGGEADSSIETYSLRFPAATDVHQRARGELKNLRDTMEPLP